MTANFIGRLMRLESSPPEVKVSSLPLLQRYFLSLSLIVYRLQLLAYLLKRDKQKDYDDRCDIIEILQQWGDYAIVRVVCLLRYIASLFLANERWDDCVSERCRLCCNTQNPSRWHYFHLWKELRLSSPGPFRS